jgi:hypothetical protein
MINPSIMAHRPDRFGAMKLNHTLMASFALFVAVGCTGSTAVSTQPTADEIQQGKQRRLAEIEKMNVPETAKQRMRDQVNGGSPNPTPERK